MSPKSPSRLGSDYPLVIMPSKLSWWTESGHWWDVRTTHLTEQRQWRLLAVPHPSAHGTRDGYSRERELLAKML
jgi:hypothetical protein